MKKKKAIASIPPTPAQQALFHAWLQELQKQLPGVQVLPIDATMVDTEWLHPVPPELDQPTEAELQELQAALARSLDPRNIKGLPPPPFRRPTFTED